MPINRLGPGAGMAASQRTETSRNEADTPAGSVSHEKQPGAKTKLRQALSRLKTALTRKEARTVVTKSTGIDVASIKAHSSPKEKALIAKVVFGPGPPPTDVPIPPDAPPQRPSSITQGLDKGMVSNLMTAMSREHPDFATRMMVDDWGDTPGSMNHAGPPPPQDDIGPPPPQYDPGPPPPQDDIGPPPPQYDPGPPPPTDVPVPPDSPPPLPRNHLRPPPTDTPPPLPH